MKLIGSTNLFHSLFRINPITTFFVENIQRNLKVLVIKNLGENVSMQTQIISVFEL